MGAYSAQLEQYAKAIEIYEQVRAHTHAWTHTCIYTCTHTRLINAFQMSQRGLEPYFEGYGISEPLSITVDHGMNQNRPLHTKAHAKPFGLPPSFKLGSRKKEC